MRAYKFTGTELTLASVIPSGLASSALNSISISEDGLSLAISSTSNTHRTTRTTPTSSFANTGTLLNNHRYSDLSADGNRLVTSPNASDAFSFYDLVDGVSILNNPSVQLPINSNAVPIGYGQSLVMHFNSPTYVIRYDVEGTRIKETIILYTGTPVTANSGRSASSQDGVYRVVSQAGAPNLSYFRLEGDRYVKRPNPTVGPSTSNAALACDEHMRILVAVGTITNVDQAIAYRRDESDLLIPMATSPAVDAPALTSRNSIHMTRNGSHLAVCMGALGSRFSLFKIVGEAFELLDPVYDFSALNVRAVKFSPNGKYMVVCMQEAPYAILFKRVGDTFAEVLEVEGLDSGDNQPNFSEDSKLLSLASYSGGIRIYEVPSMEEVAFVNQTSVTNSFILGPRNTLVNISGNAPRARVFSMTDISTVTIPEVEGPVPTYIKT